ncbi:MAG: OmpA family protein [Burkholderiaceae bacterium]|nr:OmpA family protein [Burkholderiaceae bacterium]
MTAVAVLALSACSTPQPVQEQPEFVDTPEQSTQAPEQSAQAPIQPVVKRPAKKDTIAEDFATTAGNQVFFDNGRWFLKPSAKKTLDQQVKWLNHHPNVKVRIEGNTDITGTAESNVGLGQRRADIVKSYLVEQGIAASRIRAVSRGQTRPIDPSKSRAAFAQNRNATTVILGTGHKR